MYQVFEKMYIDTTNTLFHNSNSTATYCDNVFTVGAADRVACSHMRSHMYFQESLRNNDCPFTAYPCESYVRKSLYIIYNYIMYIALSHVFTNVVFSSKIFSTFEITLFG